MQAHTGAYMQEAAGVHFTTYNAQVDRLTVMKNSFPEELFVTGFAKAGTAPVISIVAFRWAMARYLSKGLLLSP